MAEKRESSLLFSLRELRQIEEDRIKSEETAARQREEDARAAAAAEVRRQREEEERKRREIEDAERARQDAEERRQREDMLRLQESEKRAQVEAQARLEEQRLKMEIEAKAREASTKRARILVAVSASLLVIAVIAVLLVKWSKDREAESALKAQIANQRVAEESAKREAQQRQIERVLADIRQDDAALATRVAELNKAKSGEEQRRINDEMARI